MNARELLAYYSREDIQEFLISFSRQRETVGVFRNGSFSKRPNTLVYPQDIVSQVRSGVVEFHSSIELWENPMTLSKREGFDLIFDLDCKHFEHGKIAASVLMEALEKHGIKSASAKFSGNRGFHVGIPWSSVPREVGYKPSASLFPDLARKVGLYLREYMRPSFEKALLRRQNPEKLAESLEIPLKSLLTPDGIDPFKAVDIDPVLISPRHLFRSPYSINKKTFLVSVPVSDLEGFEKPSASPGKVRKLLPFLQEGEEGEAELLVAEGLDWASKHETRQPPKKTRLEFQSKIPETMFPPCVKNIQAGLKDGKKRSVFILINFLRSVKWGWEEIGSFLKDWNKKNVPPLSEQYLVTQLRYYRDKKSFPPPNCYHSGWYLGFQVCSPDSTCVSREDIKNPVNYPLRLLRKKGFIKSKQSKTRARKKAFSPKRGFKT